MPPWRVRLVPPDPENVELLTKSSLRRSRYKLRTVVDEKKNLPRYVRHMAHSNRAPVGLASSRLYHRPPTTPTAN